MKCFPFTATCNMKEASVSEMSPEPLKGQRKSEERTWVLLPKSPVGQMYPHKASHKVVTMPNNGGQLEQLG